MEVVFGKVGRRIKGYSCTGTPLTPPAAQTPETQNIDWSKVTAMLGTTGKQNGTLLRYSFPITKLRELKWSSACEIGMATAINFSNGWQSRSSNINGRFCCFFACWWSKIPVIKALTRKWYYSTAIHSHMLHDEPRLFMMHFGQLAIWTIGKRSKSCLDKTNSKHDNKMKT